MQANYNVPNVVWEPVDTGTLGRHSWLQIFSTHFPSGIGYLLSLKTILIPRKSQQTNACSNTCFEQPQKSPVLFGLNFECLWYKLLLKGVSE